MAALFCPSTLAYCCTCSKVDIRTFLRSYHKRIAATPATVKKPQQLNSQSPSLLPLALLLPHLPPYLYSLLQVPQRVETLVKEGQLYAAVQAHLQAASMLEREGIMAVSDSEGGDHGGE